MIRILAGCTSEIAPMSSSIAPRTTGTLMRKEIARADFCSIFRSKRAVIVTPDLDIPGRIANPCTSPMITRSFVVISSRVRCALLRDGRRSTIPVRMSMTPIKRVAPSPDVNECLSAR